MSDASTPETPRWQDGEFGWNECATPDVAKAKAFYCGLFGWEAVDRPMPGGGEGAYTMLRQDGRDVAGMHGHCGGDHAPPPCWAVYVRMADVDAAVTRAVHAGGTAPFPPMDVPGVGRIAAVLDPAGAMFSVYREGGQEGAARGGGPGTFCWNELLTRDLGGALPFYRSVFPWEPVEQSMTGERYVVWMRDGNPAGGAIQIGEDWPPEVPSHWLGYVSVTDCDATAARCTELGGSVCHGPADIPGIGRFAILIDPFGAVIGVITTAQQG